MPFKIKYTKWINTKKAAKYKKKITFCTAFDGDAIA